MKHKKSILKFLTVILCLLPIVLGFLYVFFFSADVPFKDEWDIEVFCLEKYHSGNLSFFDLLRSHNEHRMFFPRIAMILLGLLTGYSSIAEMYFLQFLFLIILIIILMVIRKQFNIKIPDLQFVLIFFLIFSIRQYENMLMGCQICFIFACLFSIMTFYLIYISGENEKTFPFYFTGALITATMASFSAAMGLLVWPAGFLQILITLREKKKKLLYSAIWIIAGFIEWIIYFTVDYTKPPSHPDVFSLFYLPFKFILYFFTCLGNGLSWDKITSPIIGAIIFFIFLSVFFLLYKKKRITVNSFWLAMCFYSLFIVTSISVGRCGFGAEQALVSRYSTFTLIFTAGLYVLVIDLINYKKNRLLNFLYSFLTAIIIIGLIFSYKCGVDEGIRIKKKEIILLLFF